MKPVDDPFVSLPAALEAEADFGTLVGRVANSETALTTQGAAVVARFDGFDILDQPLVAGVAACPGEKLVARSTVALRRAQIGRPVVLLFENGDPRLPLIVGVVEDPLAPAAERTPSTATVIVDGERQLIEAEREIVLRCGDASITLTRAGKVLIQGRYVLSKSSGVNRIKGAAVDIN